ncbi:uncharacterized protein FIESC28_11155 [Fusarium coffeatum]|uniref:Fungal calcium binding protein domain-containing protein n=1 Tax=Fusarium coffeatum TaxID=231269 RepID=A0A366QQD0_9HYPO|nr:uncharacterized protein FIESC28_11155 [Fusarium coffeatum]RBR06140.1 hypothetical protein FIESC28_11155 [Fusarium coffeatum]
MKFSLAILCIAAMGLAAPVAEQESTIEKRCDRKQFSQCILAYNIGCAGLPAAGVGACLGQSSNACREVSGQGDC